jgi:EmrB/QacA subfamily drug resistance transporter
MARKWWTLVAVNTGLFMLLIDLTIVVVALPDIQSSFHASFSDLQWMIDAYALTLAAFLLTAGSLADLYGRRLLFLTGLVFFTLGSLACALATGPLFLIISRGAQGIGGAILFATTFALVADAFRDARERAIAFALVGATTGVAVAVGPVLGGLLTSGLSWRWIFYINLPIGVAAILITLRKVDESRNTFATRPDILGFLTFSAGLAALIYGLIRSTPDGWGSDTVVASLVVSGVLLTAFFVVERLQREPMFDLSLLRVPTFDGALTAAWAVNATIFSLLTYVILYLQQPLGLSAAETGVRLLPLSGAIFVASALAGRLSERVPKRVLIAFGFVLVGVGLLLMRGLTTNSTWTHLLAGMIVSGVGAGFINVPLAATAVGVVEPARAGMASGINTTLRQVGTATGVAALGSIFASHVRTTVTDRLSTGTLAPHARAIGHAVGSGGINRILATVPPELHPTVLDAGKAGFVDGLNTILLIGGIVAFAAGTAVAALVRERDMVETTEEEPVAAVA